MFTKEPETHPLAIRVSTAMPNEIERPVLIAVRPAERVVRDDVEASLVQPAAPPPDRSPNGRPGNKAISVSTERPAPHMAVRFGNLDGISSFGNDFTDPSAEAPTAAGRRLETGKSSEAGVMLTCD